MVKEAEQYREEDEKHAARIESKNKFESYIYNIKSSVLTEEKMKTALGDDLSTVEKVVEEFGIPSIEVEKMAKLDIEQDKRFS